MRRRRTPEERRAAAPPPGTGRQGRHIRQAGKALRQAGPASCRRRVLTCTSSRPGRSSASSSMSLRLVMPMSRMLFSASTPSILVSSWKAKGRWVWGVWRGQGVGEGGGGSCAVDARARWLQAADGACAHATSRASSSHPPFPTQTWFTIVSCTPEPSRTEPRALQMASISSKMMTCSSARRGRRCVNSSDRASLLGVPPGKQHAPPPLLFPRTACVAALLVLGLCVSKQVANVLLRGAHVLVQHLGAVDHLPSQTRERGGALGR